MKRMAIILTTLAAAACAADADVEITPTVEAADAAAGESSAAAGAPDLYQRQLDLLDEYFAVYRVKDVEAMLSLYDEDITGVLYPATLFGVGIEAARPGVEGDFAARPGAYVNTEEKFRIARDKWLVFGESVNRTPTGGEERAPIWILFDLNDAGDKIEATYTQVAFAGFIDGPSVAKPTDQMTNAFSSILDALVEGVFNSPADHFARDASLYAYPPTALESFSPVITGGDDVFSVLAYKWGEGAWTRDLFIARYMQYAFVGAPGPANGFAAYLEAHALSDAAFADRAGVAPSTVNRWRRGEVMPEPGSLAKIAKATGGVVSASDFTAHGVLDRVALFTFDADPDSPSFEKVIRVDVMGPSGG